MKIQHKTNREFRSELEELNEKERNYIISNLPRLEKQAEIMKLRGDNEYVNWLKSEKNDAIECMADLIDPCYKSGGRSLKNINDLEMAYIWNAERAKLFDRLIMQEKSGPVAGKKISKGANMMWDRRPITTKEYGGAVWSGVRVNSFMGILLECLLDEGYIKDCGEYYIAEGKLTKAFLHALCKGVNELFGWDKLGDRYFWEEFEGLFGVANLVNNRAVSPKTEYKVDKILHVAMKKSEQTT